MSDGQRDAVTQVFVNVGKAIAAYERRIELAHRALTTTSMRSCKAGASTAF